MTYEQTLEWMFAQLPMYQNQGASAFRKDLTNTHRLMSYLGHPERELICIHVAGTNGKGSTSHMLASIFQSAGYKTGLFTSPHLKDYRERIRINGKPIQKEYVMKFMDEHRAFFERENMSFFEMSTGLAFSYFLDEGTEVAIIETGMGGRLDSTNVVQPEVSIITNIGLDHQQFLGDTFKQIAFEKAGIIKEKTAVIIGEYTEETRAVFEAIALMENAPIVFAQDHLLEDYPSDLQGDYQVKNRQTVLRALIEINKQGRFKISDQAIAHGLMHVQEQTGLQGRWQILGQQPKIICDTGHNAHGFAQSMEQLQAEPCEKLHIVLGFVADKSLENILPLFPTKAQYYFCAPANQRAMSADKLQQFAEQYSLNGLSYNSVVEAYAAARLAAKPEDIIFIGGSNFVVGEIL